MLRVLTVDDSRAVRTIVRKQITEMGFEACEAEDGEQGLTRLKEESVDLILLDVTMPVLDGPGMLARMRESGNKTPVIMLTSESKRSIVANAMKLGIDDYILKPFKPEELKAKMMAIIGAAATVDDEPMAAAAVSSAPEGPAAAARQFVDVLVIDDMENVARKLRERLPPHMTMASYTSAQSGLAACREKTARVIMIDNELPDVSCKLLTRQLRLLQPQAALLAMALHSTNDVAKELKEDGFDDLLYKPFSEDAIHDFLIKYFDTQELLVCTENVFKVGPFRGKEDRIPVYYERLNTLFVDALKGAASACYDDVILDLTLAPMRQEKLPRLLLANIEQAKEQGIELRLVGTSELKRLLGRFAETSTLPLYETAQDARRGNAS